MRKGNIIVIAIFALLSIELVWLWNFLGFSFHDPIDFVLAIIWWVVIVGVCIAIIVTEHRRRAIIRTIFVSDGLLYNYEAGVVRLGGDRDEWNYIQCMKDVLGSLDYDSQARISQDQPRVRFNYIVRTNRYLKDGRVWRGEVINARNAREHKAFSNAQDLSIILAQ